ncbi:MAG TPA: hypothetical protein VG868_06015 [Casimicrobiaceae bacterium]|nr:hypothetical protein [Casimicrobiaceae bacterium]
MSLGLAAERTAEAQRQDSIETDSGFVQSSFVELLEKRLTGLSVRRFRYSKAGGRRSRGSALLQCGR